MASRYRPPGGEKNAKTGIDWTRLELEKVCDLYIELEGKGIHESNPKIHVLAKQLGRTVRSVENQLLGFRKVATNDTGRQNYNRLIPIIWKARFEKKEPKIKDSGLHFRISSALKDIIGRDLITDEYIAIFELVKNSFDAYATRVDIIFENINSNNAKIIIKDNGKGMNQEDLIEKWLFVAYSAKREGVEDENIDYRDIINKKKAFAGAKGIGRFSCDKLGAKLLIESVTRNETKAHQLRVNWDEFENDSQIEFKDIPVEYNSIKNSTYHIKHGTVLEITELRTAWDRDKLKILRRSLAKLVNPNRGKGEQPFRIFIYVPGDEEEQDKKEEKNERVNGEIENFVFETLGLKTTKIASSISEDGKYITTELEDGGRLIYRIKEHNYSPLLNNIDCTLYYLNRSAKMSFKSIMGVTSKDYGHVFLYKNGFRIYPYGESGEDPLKIDVRKLQGTNRYLGTRELIGQIEIYSDSDQFKETSSRGDGLIKNDTYYELENFFWTTLRRLERYVVDVQKWGLSITEENNADIKSRITDLIAKLSGSDSIVEFEYLDNFFEIIESGQNESAVQVINNLKKIAVESKDNRLLKEVEKAYKRLEEINLANQEAEKEIAVAQQNAIRVKRLLEQKESENLFLRSVKSQDLDEIVSLMHHVGISASLVDNYLSGLYNKINKGIIPPERVKSIIKTVLFENKKIQNISRFATKANFKLYTDAIELDINDYLKEYINNIVSLDTNHRIKIKYKSDGTHYKNKFRPIELNILVDNMLSNSKKAGATEFYTHVISNKKNVIISFKDNGRGMNAEQQNEVFKYGYTTNFQGSGLGLYHVHEIITRIRGTIVVKSEINKGTEFLIKI